MTKKKPLDQWKSSWQIIDETTAIFSHFREIPGTGGEYRVSKTGQVISAADSRLPSGKWVVLRPRKSSPEKPYLSYLLTFPNRKRRFVMAARLILMAWIGPPPHPKSLAATKDGNISNLDLDNLSWQLPQEVKQGSIKRGTWAHGNKLSRTFTERQVKAIREIFNEYHIPVNLLARAMAVRQPRLREIKNYDCWKSITE